jgi:uncharacterized membrane protein
MQNTKARNGVLLYVCLIKKQFAIIGDEGINAVVEENFWDSTKNIILNNFKEAKYKEGLVKGIQNAGEQLKKYFPYEKDDSNELPNEISKG